uniref:Defensin-like protein 2B n=1 Tax=Sinapis alba TaxID=3728 RepID=DEF2B_SINAL|nr:RecName: Full=Defensin-like protein 2B; AltName: Full=Cysteine-rich antifungal protein 2B; Short=AFP2B; AltName: Full=M2B [Sinapis alba]
QKLCARPSGTWSSGNCRNNNACRNFCIKLEKSRHGSCNIPFPSNKCICYFPC